MKDKAYTELLSHIFTIHQLCLKILLFINLMILIVIKYKILNKLYLKKSKINIINSINSNL